MPHLPRHSPTSGVPPELMQPARQTHAPIPVQAAQPVKREAPQAGSKPQRLSISLPRISPHTYEPDNKQLLKTLFGKEPDVDPNTGQLVLHSTANARAGLSFGT